MAFTTKFASDLRGAATERENGRCSTSLEHVQSLTSREREVIPLVAQGLLNKQVARRLGVSEGTVKVHLHNIFQKTGVHNRTALAVLALAESRAELWDEAIRSANPAAPKPNGAPARLSCS